MFIPLWLILLVATYFLFGKRIVKWIDKRAERKDAKDAAMADEHIRRAAEMAIREKMTNKV